MTSEWWAEIEWYTSASGCANDVDLMGKSVYSRKKDTKVLLFGSRHVGLEVDTEKTKHIFVWCEQKARKIST